MDELNHLPIQLGQVFKAKIFNPCGILPVGLDDTTLINNLLNENRGSFLVMEWHNYPEVFLAMNQAT